MTPFDNICDTYMSRQAQIDDEIARFYAPMILESIGFGENQVNVWFPASGKTVVTKNVIENKIILKSVLGKMSERLLFVSVSCETASFGGLGAILTDIAFDLKIERVLNESNEDLLERIIYYCHSEIIKNDKEFVFVINKIEEIDDKEIEKLLLCLTKIVSSNPRRICTIINTKRVEILNKMLSSSYFFPLVHKYKYVPLLNGAILRKFVDEKSTMFGKNISDSEKMRLIKTYGGILSPLKQAIRSYPDTELLDVKIKSIFAGYNSKNIDKFTIHKPEIFSTNIFESPNELNETLKSKLKGKNRILFDFFEKKKKKIVSKDDIAEIIWNDAGVTDWAINQVVSRFRRKLLKLNIDPEKLETINGKGYIWR